MNAREWLARGGRAPQLSVLGGPIHRAAISPTNAHRTPAALREGLARFATWDGDHGVQLEALSALDLGDVEGDDDDPDATAAHARIGQAVRAAFAQARVVAVFGGDNSLTWPAMHGAAGTGGLADGWGLITLDAHHDCRPLDGGATNGTPVRGLISDGLPGARVAQVGINGFANPEEQAQWAVAQGVHVHRADDVRRDGMGATIKAALAELQAAGATRIYADIDIDVADRAFAPACPASMPGGLRPPELTHAAYLLGLDPAVCAVDFVEVDASADVNGTTVRLMASTFLSFCAGLAGRAQA